MSNTTNTAKAILHALGYTPKTLAADIDVSIFQARRILSDGGKLYFNELTKISRVTGVSPNILMGISKPGTRREVSV